MKSIFVIGPSGSGKSTLSQYLTEIYKSIFGCNSVILVNLDPANPSRQESLYDIDMNNLITIQDIMQQFQIGPNGAMLYAMDFLYQNKTWLSQSLTKQIAKKQPHYRIAKQLQFTSTSTSHPQLTSPFIILFDLPGQVQLYLQNQSTKSLINYLKQTINQNSCILELFDSTYIYQVNDFVSLCMMSLVTMINLELPQINVMNKIDVIRGERPSLGMLNQYFDIYSIKGIVDDLTFCDDQNKDGNAILTSISSVIDQFSQVSFIPCSVYKIDLIKYLILQIQKTFNTHQINKFKNKKYASFIESVDRTMAKQEIISQLQNQLFKQEQQEIQQEKQEIEKVLGQIKKQIQGKTTKNVRT